MQAFRRKAMACGAHFVAAQATGFRTEGSQVRAVRCADGRHVAATAVVLAAGAWTAPLAAQLGVHLPVVAKKRDVFVLDSPALLPQCPLVVDPGGVWFRPEGRGFIAGAPPRDDAADEAPLEAIDHAWFDERIWPLLAARVPAFEALRVRSAWAGYYEMNTFDHNGLAGALPGWRNAYTACGFSGHGMQQAPAVGSALAAQVAGGRSDAPGLEALSVQRLAEGRPLVEQVVI
jgi:FAD-dependent oxidoreductase domain-containing protein 1